ncbi:MAG: hypothetical protein A3A80_02940 [Candidatus Terrybacteria bacterium RIFCSPLOWO2_01_FULL_44_24]|uniref:Uncharacterized protein n=1 Tax=Candidatus Terrybacteria bacterium RIFCSPHIGHO2_01_FULL_43_35 TaxID=1802361 RepID=A0A1G2PGK3_9BACT|nr:MAG: hypothetical protein A2828_03125 [Candidatus Terrybacteria bacterium RIFCSPHIGHO2_01_FULL_43_35]OHA51020.1 MAG: hypothetical protein A3A80_02940 [Candidatus Terrybacteria bacterium RIFCSPLOWO2_01_FULL_44_24]
MFEQTSTNEKLYAVWKVDRKTDEAYLTIDSRNYPLTLKLETFAITSSGDQNIELIRNGVKELLSQLNICCRCCDTEKIIDDVVSFLTNKNTDDSILKQWFSCTYQAIYE